MATHSSILAWIIPWTEEPGGLQSIGSKRVKHDKQLSMHFTSINRRICISSLINKTLNHYEISQFEFRFIFLLFLIIGLSCISA